MANTIIILLLALVGTAFSRQNFNFAGHDTLLARISAENAEKQRVANAPAITKGVATPPAGIQCSKGGNRRVQDPSDPTKFYMCHFSGTHQIWIMYSFNCPKALKFDEASQKCLQNGGGRLPYGNAQLNQQNVKKIISDRVMAKINAMLQANMTKAQSDQPFGGIQPQSFNPVAATPNPLHSSTQTHNVNAIWAEQIKNYLKWHRQGALPTTTSKYPNVGVPAYAFRPGLYTTPSSTTPATTTMPPTTTSAPVQASVAKNQNTMQRIKLYASKMSNLAEEIQILVTCMETTDNCDKVQNSEEYSAEVAHISIVKKDRPDMSEEYSQEESSSNEEDAVAVHLSTAATTPAPTPQPLEMTTATAVKTKEWNLFIPYQPALASNTPVALKPPQEDASSPKSSHEVDDSHIDTQIAQVMQDILRHPPTPYDGEQASPDATPVPIQVHGHTLFDSDDQTSDNKQDDRTQGDTPDDAQDPAGSGHRKPRTVT